MEYRPFGQTGLEVSAVGYGCWEIGGGYGAIEETDFVRAVPSFGILPHIDLFQCDGCGEIETIIRPTQLIHAREYTEKSRGPIFFRQPR